MNRKTQCQIVLAHMKNIGWISQWTAWRHYRISRLGGRIYDLDKAGYDLDRRWVKKRGKRFKEYGLAA